VGLARAKRTPEYIRPIELGCSGSPLHSSRLIRDGLLLDVEVAATWVFVSPGRKCPKNMEQLYLSRRNLLTLLSKLDRVKRGEGSMCTLVKQDLTHPKYPASVVVRLTAVEDEDYYTDRLAGQVHPADEPR